MSMPLSFAKFLVQFAQDLYPTKLREPVPLPTKSILSNIEVERLFDELIHITEEDDLGLRLGSSGQLLEAFGVVGLIARNASNVSDMLRLGLRYGPLIGNPAQSVKQRLVCTREGLVIQNKDEDRRCRQLNETLTALLVHIVQLMTGYEQPLLRIRFTHPKPASIKTHRAIFSGAELDFDSNISQIILPAELVNLPNRSSDAATLRILRGIADAELQTLPASSLALDKQVQEFVRIELQRTQNVPPLAFVAQMMALSERTLQRRLAQQGLKFRALVDAVRKHEALRLIEERDLTPEMIASRIGLDGPRSLRRAIKRWTGTTPGVLRKQHS